MEKVHGSLRSLTDEVGFIYVLEKVHGSLRSLTDEAGIIYVLEKVVLDEGCMVLSCMVPRSLTDEVGIIYIPEKLHDSLRTITDEAGTRERCMVLSDPSLMRYVQFHLRTREGAWFSQVPHS